MSKPRKAVVNVKGTDVTVLVHRDEDYISLTDIARHRNTEHTDDLIRNWLRNRNTIEFLGIWESLNNPAFKPVEFDGFRRRAVTAAQAALTYATEADVLNVALFGHTARAWRQTHPGNKGNVRDVASIEQLLVLANIESLNAELIRMRVTQGERLKRLNQIAIRQMQVLTTAPALKRLKE